MNSINRCLKALLPFVVMGVVTACGGGSVVTEGFGLGVTGNLQKISIEDGAVEEIPLEGSAHLVVVRESGDALLVAVTAFSASTQNFEGQSIEVLLTPDQQGQGILYKHNNNAGGRQHQIQFPADLIFSKGEVFWLGDLLLTGEALTATELNLAALPDPVVTEFSDGENTFQLTALTLDLSSQVLRVLE